MTDNLTMTKPFDPAELLASAEAISAYLEEVFQDGDSLHSSLKR